MKKITNFKLQSNLQNSQQKIFRQSALGSTVKLLLTFFTLFSVAFFGAASLQVLAQDSTSDREVTGELTRKQDSELTLDVDGQSQTYTVPDNVLIELNEQESELQDIGLGDQITLTLDSDGEVTQVEAITGDVLDWLWWAAGILVVVIILAVIILIITRKTNKSEIMTTPATKIKK